MKVLDPSNRPTPHLLMYCPEFQVNIVQSFDHKLTEYTLDIPLINLRLLQPIQNSYSQKESHHIVRLNGQPFERLPQN